MTVIPLGDRILVRLVHTSQSEATASTEESSADEAVRGIVIAAGAGRPDHRGQNVPLAIAAGDTVLFGKHLGREITFGGIHCWILKADDIVKVESKAVMTVLRGPSLTRRS